MAGLNTGPTGAHSRVSVITLFGALFFGFALLAALPGGALSAGTPLTKTGNSANANDMCWQVVSSPNQGTGGNRLNAAAGVSVRDVWAVGFYGSGAPRTLIEHWDGSTWTVVPSPNQGTGSNYLNGVAAVSANDVWAVGFYDNDLAGEAQTLVEHWNGFSWSVISSPSLSGSDNYLSGVAAVAANDVWAVGSSRPAHSGYNSQPLIEHWNGSSWAVVPSPSPAGSFLNGVAAVAANDVWAVGSRLVEPREGVYVPLVEHWDGTAWNLVPFPSLWPSTRDYELNGVAAVAANDVWTVGFRDNDTLVAHWDGRAWSVVPSPNQSTGWRNRLAGVAVVSANDVWAVGSYRTASLTDFDTLIEHWDGSTWTLVPSPNQGAGENYLNGVAAVSASDVWAAGNFHSQGSLDQTLIGRWNGAEWSIISSPNQGTGENYLNGVNAVSANDVWAVGYYKTTSMAERNLVEHWNGDAWTVVSSPNQGTGGSRLEAVSVVSANDVWAVGYYSGGASTRTLVEHWNGDAWTVVSSPGSGTYNSLYGVTAVSANDVWAVGYYGDIAGPVQTLVEHWNGTAWSVITSPNRGPDSRLYGVDAVSANDVWAVGEHYEEYSYNCQYLSSPCTLVEHWNGIEWSVVPSPSPHDLHHLYAVAAVSANDVWAVGYYLPGDGHYKTLIEHWNGIEWSVVPSANSGSYDNFLYAVAAVSANDVWTVGGFARGISTTSDQTLIEHWDGTAWTVVSSPNQGPTPNNLQGVIDASPGDMWAVGTGPGGTLAERYAICPAQTATPTSTSTPTTSTPTTCAIQYPDVPRGSTFYQYVHCLACRGIVSGYPDGTFGTNNPVTRGQLSKIVSNSAGYTESFSTNTFEDVAVGSTFFPYVERLYAHGGIGGYPCGGPGEPCLPPANKPYFRPGANVTRGQTSKIVAIACMLPPPSTGQQTFQDVAPGSIFWQWIEPLAATGAIGGYPCGGPGEPCVPPTNRPYFRPGANVTRGQSAKIVSNTFFPNCATPIRR